MASQHDNTSDAPLLYSSDAKQVNVTVTLPLGAVIIPAWLVLCFVSCFVFSAIALISLWDTNRKLVGEIRVLQIYQEDVESVLIRNNIATRSDFIPHSTVVIPVPIQLTPETTKKER